MDREKDMEAILKHGERILEELTDKKTVKWGSEEEKEKKEDVRKFLGSFYLFRIDEITYEDKVPSREAVENIFGSFRGIAGITLLYMILGDEKGVHFYLGVAGDQKEHTLTVSSISEILSKSILGNFRGCKLSPIDEDHEPGEKMRIWERLKKAQRTGILTGVPTIERNSRNEFQSKDVQGTDRLIDVMSGTNFGYVILARPYTDEEMDRVEKQLIRVCDDLAPLAQYSLQSNEMTSHHEGSGKVSARASQKSDGYNGVESFNETTGENYSRSDSHSTNHTDQGSQSDSWSEHHSQNSSTSRADTYTDQQRNSSNGTSDSLSYHVTADSSKSKGKQTSHSDGETTGDSHTSGRNVSKTTSSGKSASHSSSFVESANESKSSNDSTGWTSSILGQLPVPRTSAASWMKYISEVLLPRLDNGRGKGLFLSCSYLFVDGDDRDNLYRLANTAISLFSGTRGNKAPLHFSEHYDKSQNSVPEACIRSMQNFRIPEIVCDSEKSDEVMTVLSCKQDGNHLCCGSWLSSDELGLIAGFPQKEVVGLPLRKEVDFGLNVKAPAEGEKLHLGKLIQCGTEKTDIYLNKNDLDKHTFIAGTTGSGKTTTCLNLLKQCDWPFLVIEPVKNEYRILKDEFDDVIYFTPGNQKTAPFFLNPFEIFPGEDIVSRADMIKATMESSFEMQAAIPQILETAIFKAYEDRGWNINKNTWHGKSENDEDGPFSPGSDAFPRFSDFIEAIHEVIKKSNFGDRLGPEYQGTIDAMVGSLVIGAKGQMLNVPKSVSFSDLVNKRVVIELEGIRSGAEKSMLMGFVLTNLMEAVRREHAKNRDFHHITLVEEAHRLLSRYMPGDSFNKKQGVEVFSDMLAEVRKYGEALIIVDQIPNKMTPEVLKNTNTKIVHKLFAQDDKDAIGNTMALDKDQKAYLSNLPTGRAVVFSQGWDKAVQVQVEKVADTSGKEITDEEIHKRAVGYYASDEALESGVFPKLADKDSVTEAYMEKYLADLGTNNEWIHLLANVFSNPDSFRLKCNRLTPNGLSEAQVIFKKIKDGFKAENSRTEEELFSYAFNELFEMHSFDHDEVDSKKIKDCVKKVFQDLKTRDEIDKDIISHMPTNMNRYLKPWAKRS